MFTGIVEETGEIVARERTDDGLRLRIGADEVATGLEHGQSISVSGACLTVERYDEGAWFEVFLATENRRADLSRRARGRRRGQSRAGDAGRRPI